MISKCSQKLVGVILSIEVITEQNSNWMVLQLSYNSFTLVLSCELGTCSIMVQTLEKRDLLDLVMVILTQHFDTKYDFTKPHTYHRPT